MDAQCNAAMNKLIRYQKLNFHSFSLQAGEKVAAVFTNMFGDWTDDCVTDRTESGRNIFIKFTVN